MEAAVSPRRRFPVLCALTLLLAAAGAVVGTSYGSPGSAGPAFFRAAYHGNLSLEGIGPSEVAPVQSNLTFAYELRDPSYSAGEAGLFVRLPGTVAVFNVSGAPDSFTLPAKNIAISSSNWTSPANTTFSEILPQATSFTGGTGAGRGAVLSSQSLALTSPLPFGSLRVDVRWNWTLLPSLGPATAQASGWIPGGNGSSVQPDQSVQFSAPNGLSVSPGGSFEGCVAGAIAGRTFSLHAQTNHPIDDFVQANATVPRDASGPFCWPLPIPSYVVPQTILVRLWDYADFSPANGTATTVLLVSQSVKVIVAGPAPAPAYEDPLYWGVGVAAAAAVIAAAVFLRRRRPRAPPPSVRPDPSEAAASDGRRPTPPPGSPP